MGLNFNVPKKIFLYVNTKERIDLEKISRFVKQNFGKIDIAIKRIDFVRVRGLLFDFLALNSEFINKVSAKFRKPVYCHIAITDKLFATYDDFKKLHIRASIFGYPSVISVSGIVQGPAKPREYYILKQKYTQLGVWDIEEAKVKNKFRQRFIDYQDKRLTEVIKGYIAQSLLFFTTGNPFCKNKSCRLFNAHWQEDLIHAQVKSGKFCKSHKKILDSIKNKETPDA